VIRSQQANDRCTAARSRSAQPREKVGRRARREARLGDAPYDVSDRSVINPRNLVASIDAGDVGCLAISP
jgi:hypothetical protein